MFAKLDTAIMGDQFNKYLIWMHDLHRHFSGSLTCELVSILSGIPLNDVKKAMTFRKGDKFDYASFFNKFNILDSIEWDYNKISLSIKDVVWGLKREGIGYTEIKFSINKYAKYLGDDYINIVRWFLKEFDNCCSDWGIEADLILSLKHDMDKSIQRKMADIIKDDVIAEYIAGVDIVGNENYFDVNFYKPIFDMWHSAGRICLAHVGEINKPQNVIDAIKILKVDRVCHGIAAAHLKDVAKIANDHNVAFDVSITSNICTGVATLKNHPVKKMIKNGFTVNIGTDDPVIFNTNIDNEYKLLQIITGISDFEVNKIKSNSAIYSAKELLKLKNK